MGSQRKKNSSLLESSSRFVPQETDYRHWLGLGAEGAELLLSSFCPYLYACDQVLCRRILRLAHRIDSHGERPLAVLAPPADFVGWHLPFLAKDFTLVIWTSELGDYVEEAASAFGAEIFSGEIPTGLNGAVDLFLYTDFNWDSEDTFYRAVLEAKNCLTPDGEALFILRASGVEEALSINWFDGTESCLAETLRGARFFGAGNPLSEERVSFSQLRNGASERLREFAKRHRQFFGRSSHDLLSIRMLAEDFRQAEQADDAWSVLLAWQASLAQNIS